MARVKRRGPRGLTPAPMVTAALALAEAGGLEAVTVRALARRVGCDPMTVLHHLGSAEGLQRAMAEALNAQVAAPPARASWRARLAHQAAQLRVIALRHPRAFPLLLRFQTTGPADLRNAERVYAALLDAGLRPREVVDACFGWFAAVLGLAAAEAGGMLATPGRPGRGGAPPPDASTYPAASQVAAEFARQRPGRAHAAMVEVLLDGLAARAAGVAPAGRRGRRR